MTTKEDAKVYRCLDCGKHVLDKRGCSAHSGRAHKNYTLTDENFDDHFRWVKNPKPEMLEKLLKSRDYAKKKYDESKKKKPPKKSPKSTPSYNAEILAVGQPEIVEGGIVLGLTIKVPISIEIPEVISTAK